MKRHFEYRLFEIDCRTLVTTDSSYCSAEDCKVKEMVGNRGEEAFIVELQEDGQ